MEPKVQIVIAEQLQQQQSGQGQVRNLLVNPVIALRVPFIPGAVTFTISIMTYGIDFGMENKFQLEIHKMEDPTEIVYEIPEQKIEAGVIVQTDNFNFNFELTNTAFYSQGDFTVKFILNGQEHLQNFVLKADETLTRLGK